MGESGIEVFSEKTILPSYYRCLQRLNRACLRQRLSQSLNPFNQSSFADRVLLCPSTNPRQERISDVAHCRSARYPFLRCEAVLLPKGQLSSSRNAKPGKSAIDD